MSTSRIHMGPSVNVSAIIVRACGNCGHRREFGKPCEGCGSEKPPDVEDLGVIASHKKSRWERVKWNLYGYHAAQRRIRRINKEACGQ
jgi:hypothetical protein